MRDLIIYLVAGGVAWWFYKTGKRIGSKLGYRAGRAKHRRRRR